MSGDRYASMQYNRCGRSGLRLPAISLGLWQGPGSYVGDDIAADIVRTAFDHGITHFDLANNYGSPPGASEALMGKILKHMPRHELVISTKAGYRMWPGPYGDGGSRKHLVESCEQSLRRVGIEYVDIFYSHRYDAETPLEETLEALHTLIRQGKALYAGLSNYGGTEFADAIRIAHAPIILNQTNYSLLRRDAETEVLPIAREAGIGVVAYSPLAQGLLTEKYLKGVPADSRAILQQGNGAITRDRITPEVTATLQRLAGIAVQRGQSLAQMALSWLLSDARVTSVIIGASKAQQVIDCIACLRKLRFSDSELAAVDAAVAPTRS